MTVLGEQNVEVRFARNEPDVLLPNSSIGEFGRAQRLVPLLLVMTEKRGLT